LQSTVKQILSSDEMIHLPVLQHASDVALIICNS